MSVNDDARQSLDVAEDARETEWTHPSFAAELFVGNYRPELIFPYPTISEEDEKTGDEFMKKVADYVVSNLDPEKVDETREFPEGFIDGLVALGAYGIKIGKEYGGLGLGQTNYARVMSALSSYDASLAVRLSAHQSIGVPVPLKHFGTKEQKEKYLPRLAKGELSAFALTEVDVGSDPARMTLDAKPEGDHWVLNGKKLWCTNGTIADLLIVMARTPSKMIKGKERPQISAFIVETNTEGFSVEHRCDFMGLKGIHNGVLKFDNVKVPNENLLGGEGKGLKLALTTLNTGRLTLPSAAVGISKKALRYARLWSGKRHQWGVKIGKHEAVASKLASMASDIFAMESITWLPMALVDRGGYDIRIEAAIAKLFGSERGWNALDNALQIRGGRGYETATSLKVRGEEAWPIERMYRDNRINTIIEGSSDIMHLFLAREALDPHMKAAGALVDPRSSISEKITSMIKAGLHYTFWYPKQWIPKWLFASQSHITPSLQHHGRFVARQGQRLSRSIFHSMMLYQAGLERKQMIMSRLVDIGVELYTMSATCSRATMLINKNPTDRTPIELADHFCQGARTRVKQIFKELVCNNDKGTNRLAKLINEGQVTWLEEGTMNGPDDEVIKD